VLSLTAPCPPRAPCFKWERGERGKEKEKAA